MSRKRIIITEEELNQMFLDKAARRIRELSTNPKTGEKRKVIFYNTGRGGYYWYEIDKDEN